MPFMRMPSHQYIYTPYKILHIINTATVRLFQKFSNTTTMETADYWLMACKYAIWNATIASLQFWAEDLDPVTLGITSECIYTTFFWTPTSHTLCQLPEDVLFGCFVIALNAAFTQQLSLADKGYESGSDTNDLPMPLQKTPHILHISSMDHASFNPVSTTPLTVQSPLHLAVQSPLHITVQSPLHLAVCHKLLTDQCTNAYPSAPIQTIPQTALQHVPTAQMQKKKIFQWYH